ncbi:MAG TPA: phosphotransferase [Streptosporangiaceae bacterium]|nr:phosphotransferase [Streptosporangiaceae bacterium]
MTDAWPPAWLVAELDLIVRSAPLRPRVGRAWLVEWRQEEGLLRQTPLPTDRTGVAQTRADVSWLHDFLDRLSSTGFPAPRPLPAFGGCSWTTGGGSLWQLVSFRAGQVVGWASAPSLTEVGVLLGRYHVAVAALRPAAQRPAALPLADVPAILLSGQVEAAGVSRDRAARIRSLAADLAADLTGAGQASTGRLVIHGDFTCHNVLAAGAPPAAVGVIDFELAHVESPLADIGYGLWRSGRPHQDAAFLDAARVAQFVRGYASVRAIPADQAGLIPVYLRGRGLQMIAKRVRAGQPETGMLAQVSWLSARHDAVAEICARAC